MFGKILKVSVFILIFLISIGYGILVGKYEFFPYNQLKKLQDNFTPEERMPELNKIFVDSLISVSVENIDSIRHLTLKIIFGRQTLTASMPDSVYEIQDVAYSDMENLKLLEKFVINQQYNINSIGYIFHPISSNGQLLIYHQGHKGDFLYGKKTIKYFLEKGFTVYAFSMPLLGKNKRPNITLDKIGIIPMHSHEKFKYLEYPLSYFIFPVIAMINYAEKENFENIIMVGISGGGWTTTLIAAIDTRINYSYSVAGGYPIFIRLAKPKKNYGDWEESYPELFNRVNYLDLYILSSVGNKRMHTQVLNKFDPCCFDGEFFKLYKDIVVKRVEQHNHGAFVFISDSLNTTHSISDFTLEKIYERITMISKQE